MRPHTNPGAAAVDEKPSIAAFSDRTGEKISIVGSGSLDYVGVEAPAFRFVHSGIDPQQHPGISAHALTLNDLTDIIALRRIRT